MSNVAKRRYFFFTLQSLKRDYMYLRNLVSLKHIVGTFFFTNLPLALLNFKMHFLNFM